MLDTLIEKKQLTLNIDIVTIFKDPALLPRFFQHLIAQEKLDALSHARLGKDVGCVIMNCARSVQPFEPLRSRAQLHVIPLSFGITNGVRHPAPYKLGR